MLGLKIKNKKKPDSLKITIDAIHAGDTLLLNELIESYKPFIAKTVSSVCKRYIDEGDDEFSIGLIAFNDAVQKYSHEKGSSLLSFAEVIIKNRVIDFIRKQARYQNNVVYMNADEDINEINSFQNQIEADLSYEQYLIKNEQALRAEEITSYSAILSEYKLSFNDLVKQSPKHTDARKSAISIAQLVAMNDEMRNFLLEKKKLPIKLLEPEVQVSRKTIERNRKYIMAISIIFIYDFIYLKDYIKGVLNS